MRLGLWQLKCILCAKNLRDMVASIQDAGQKINENVSELNEVTDTVNQMCSDNSATSQQLAAGMQETAATTVTINENVSQIKGEAETINTMAEEGAKNSETVMDRALQLRTKTVTASNKTMEIYNSVKEKAEKAIEGSKAVEKINELDRNYHGDFFPDRSSGFERIHRGGKSRRSRKRICCSCN